MYTKLRVCTISHGILEFVYVIDIILYGTLPVKKKKKIQTMCKLGKVTPKIFSVFQDGKQY